MADNPKFVRLVRRLSRSHVGDVQSGSGWSISGLDVKPFPQGKSEKDKAAAKFVSRLVKKGILEGAAQAEYEEVQSSREDMQALAVEVRGKSAVEPQQPRIPIQESTLREKTESRREEMLKNRGLSEDGLDAAVRGTSSSSAVTEDDLDEMNAKDIVKGLKDGSLDPEVVREYEEGRDDPRKSVLDAVDKAEEDDEDEESE